MPITSKTEQKILALKQFDGKGNPLLDQYLYPLVSIQEQGRFYSREWNGEISCWYCGYEIYGYAYPIPRQYYPEEVKFRVYGACCNLNCVKGQIIFGPRTGNSQQQLDHLTMMADLIYKVDVTLLEAFDRYLFERYGGPINHDWYMENWNRLFKILLRTDAPFIPTAMMIETGIKNSPGLTMTDADHQQLKRLQMEQMQQIIKEHQEREQQQDRQQTSIFAPKLVLNLSEPNGSTPAPVRHLVEPIVAKELLSNDAKPPKQLNKQGRAQWYRKKAQLKKQIELQENGYVAPGDTKTSTQNAIDTESQQQHHQQVDPAWAEQIPMELMVMPPESTKPEVQEYKTEVDEYKTQTDLNASNSFARRSTRPSPAAVRSIQKAKHLKQALRGKSHAGKSNKPTKSSSGNLFQLMNISSTAGVK